MNVLVPFPARRAMQQAIYNAFINEENEWTTWSDSAHLAELAAQALASAGWKVVPLDQGDEVT